MCYKKSIKSGEVVSNLPNFFQENFKFIYK
jgi:hypothetical protein